MPGNLPPTERAGGFVEGAVAATVIQALVGAFSDALDSLQTVGSTPTADTLVMFTGSVPGLTTAIGWLLAIVGGGPLGLVGYPIGVAGGGMILPPDPNPVAGFVLAFLGGALTWGGVKSGGWQPFL